MSHTKFTAPPWRQDRGAILTADNRCLAEVYSGASDNLAEHRANCRLIAAAPELLAALREIAGSCESLLANDGQPAAPDIKAAIKRAKDAIASATGEA